MVSAPPLQTRLGKTNWSHLRVSPGGLAAHLQKERGCLLGPQSRDILGSQRKLRFLLSRKGGGSALIRCRPDWAKPVGPISALAQQVSLPRNSTRSGFVSLVVKVETSLVLKRNFVFCGQEKRGEEWSALHRCRQDQASQVVPSLSWPRQAWRNLQEEPRPFLALKIEFPWVSKATSLFFMKVAWKSGQHSTAPAHQTR